MRSTLRRRLAKLESASCPQDWPDVSEMVQAAIAKLPHTARQVFGEKQLWEVRTQCPELWSLFENAWEEVCQDSDALFVISVDDLLL